MICAGLAVEGFFFFREETDVQIRLTMSAANYCTCLKYTEAIGYLFTAHQQSERQFSTQI
jgi:hypothetical protein